MSTTFFEVGGAMSGAASLSQWLRHLRVPLDAWSRRRRRVVAALIATLVFVLGAYGWITADLCGLEASRVALTASTQRLDETRRALAQLPSLRRIADEMPAVRAAITPWSSADDVRSVSELAAENGVALLAVEPGPTNGEGIERMRSLQLTARTDFVHLMAFFNGLSHLPVLMVPVDVTVKQDGAALSIGATLRVFDALRPAPAADAVHASDDASLDEDDDEEIVFFDPFSQPRLSASAEPADAVQWRLVGVLFDRTRGLALLDTPDGAATVAAGAQLGVERVTQLDELGITLANGGATRTLTLSEAS
ncbi:hypothetical protein [Paraburkholderia sp. ZP32-5]|uniref:hypothetical protein n=1 Tax=Paraburkholderia sp. ZP32-5 TaxID=2883245 RepID=UPI001F39705E|nr:hypothetical protein [Paraburkholderia sp. ZP32-5]